MHCHPRYTRVTVQTSKDPMGGSRSGIIHSARSGSLVVWALPPLQPNTFGDAIRDDLAANGLAAKHFHQELFSMR